MIRTLPAGYNAGDTIYCYFSSFAGSTGASVTITGLVVTDIECYKNGSVTQRASDNGYTLLDTDGIDFDGSTGLQGFSIDTSDNSDSGFWADGSHYLIWVDAITVDSQTVRLGFEVVLGNLLRPTTAGRKLDVSSGGEAGIDLANVGSPTTTLNLSGTTIKTATDVETDTADIQTRLGSPSNLGSGATVAANLADVHADAEASFDTVTVLATTNQTEVAKIPKSDGSVGWNATALAQINAQADTALTDYGALKPTTAGRTLDVTVGGCTGIDWGNLENAGSTVNLAATTIGVIGNGGIQETSFANGAISDLKINDGAFTANKFAASSLNGKGDWNVGKTGYTLTATTGLGNQTANITGSITNVTGGINTGSGTIQTLDALDTAQDTQHATTRTQGGAGPWGGGAGGSAYLATGTVASTTGTTTTLDVGSVATASYYVDAKLVITAGTGAGQERLISAYTSGRVATHLAWTTNPDNASTYEIRDARASVVVAGAGTGARSVNPTVTSGGSPLQNAKIRYSLGAATHLQITEADGQPPTPFGLDDGTWDVVITAEGHESITSPPLVVDGTEAPTYPMTMIAIAPPANPDAISAVYVLLDGGLANESGVTIYWRMIAPDEGAGIGFQQVWNESVTNGSGIATFAVVPGAEYEFAIASLDGCKFRYVIPDDAVNGHLISPNTVWQAGS